jgi:glycosyltransferase involved in cell wall biosynthesis
MPAFNEEKNIGQVLSSLHNVLGSARFPYEIIVVDDGSTDKTRELAYRHRAIVLTNGRNQGKGYALQRGFKYAKGDIIITIDADGSHDPEDIKRLLPPILNGADTVLGSRFAVEVAKDNTTKLHVFGNSLINLIIRIATGRCVTDSQTGFRACKRRILKGIEINSKGYEVETELTVKTLKNGYTFEEVPVTFQKRVNGCSHIRPLFDGFKIFKTIIKSVIND